MTSEHSNLEIVDRSGGRATARLSGDLDIVTSEEVKRDLAQLIDDGHSVLALDLSLIVAGTKYRGQFEERLKGILKELRENKDILVFVDEIHSDSVETPTSTGAASVPTTLPLTPFIESVVPSAAAITATRR